MENNIKISCIKVLSDLYSDQRVEINWSRGNVSFRAKMDLSEYLASMDIEHDEFVQVAFDALFTARALAIGENVSKAHWDEELLNAVKVNLLDRNPSLVHNIVIRNSPVAPVLNDIEFEVLTKRSKSVPEDVLMYSGLLHLFIKDNFTNSEETTGSTVSIELTKTDIENLIGSLQKLTSQIDALNLE